MKEITFSVVGAETFPSELMSLIRKHGVKDHVFVESNGSFAAMKIGNFRKLSSEEINSFRSIAILGNGEKA